MRALTLHRPWTWAITNSTKRIENRTWAPPECIQGKLLAIHAGKRYDREGAEWMRSEHLDVPDECDCPQGIVAVARVVGFCTKQAVTWFHGLCALGNSPQPFFRATNTPMLSFWFSGPYGWILEDVCILRRPVACSGRQGAWVVPEKIWGEALCQSWDPANVRSKAAS